MAKQLLKVTIYVLVLYITVLVCFICLISADVYQLTKPRRTYFIYDKQGRLVGTRETDIPSDNSSPFDSLSPRLRTLNSNRQQYTSDRLGAGTNKQSNGPLLWKPGNITFNLSEILKTFGKNEADFNYKPECNRAPGLCLTQALCELHPEPFEVKKTNRMASMGYSRRSRSRKSSFGQRNRIMNGEDANPFEWPQYARITYYDTDGVPHICGGVILSERHILTAGHCVGPPEMLYPSEGYEITLGDYITNEVDPGEQQMKVESVCRASKYTNTGNDVANHDWAIITLQGEANFDLRVYNGCLINEYETRNVPLLKPEAQCYVMGFGTLRPVPNGESAGPSDLPNVLQKMRVEASDCNAYGVSLVDKSRHCFANVNQNSDSCGGDSGSPVLCRHQDGRWVVMGIVSYGQDSCDGSTAVFTDIPQLLPDIFRECL